MRGKYNNRLKYWIAKVSRAWMRLKLRGVVEWRPQAIPLPGYSVIMGCRHDLLPVLRGNLTMLSRQDRANLDRVYLVFDGAAGTIPPSCTASLLQQFPELPLEVLWYTTKQAKVAKQINWAWVYAWMSWSVGISAVRTKYAILHDFDACLIRPDILRERYEEIVSCGAHYLGERFYQGNGVEREDRLASTYELVFDVEFVRSRFEPIDLFNNVSLCCGRSIEYDTFLWAQAQAGKAEILAIDEEDMVHPSQMICQYCELVQRGIQPSRQPNLPLIAYFAFLGGDERMLLEQTEGLASTCNGRIPFFGAELDLTRMSPEHAMWLKKQAFRLERAVAGSVRPQVAAYCDAITRIALSSDPCPEPVLRQV